MAALRLAKQDVALTLGLADLAGAIDLEAVTALLTRFADAALEAALRFALAEQARAGKWTGGAEAPGFFILGMGKYGARELNYSSDIDVIALFDPEAGGLSEGAEPSTFWVKIVRALVTLLQERTADGYVFRTDLRLRPDPGATRVAISAPAALLYYESMGQNWERAALVKARAVAGDIAAGDAFIRELAPFIWRKYLDFAAIADIHSIKRQVHAHRGHETVAVLGHDIKRGRGGIREIEFFVQTQQLIAGGRDPTLRGTRDARHARASRREGLDRRSDTRRAGRGLRLSAQCRAPPADGARRADASDAARPRRAGADRPADARARRRFVRGADSATSWKQSPSATRGSSKVGASFPPKPAASSSPAARTTRRRWRRFAGSASRRRNP